MKKNLKGKTRDFKSEFMHDMSKPLPVRKSKPEVLEDIVVASGKDTSSPTKILRRKSKRVGGTDRAPIYEKVKNGRAVGRMKRVGGTDRVPKYEKVKNYDDYTWQEISPMSDAEYDKMEKSSTIQYKNPDYKGAKKIKPHSRFSEGGMIVSSLYESF